VVSETYTDTPSVEHLCQHPECYKYTVGFGVPEVFQKECFLLDWVFQKECFLLDWDQCVGSSQFWPVKPRVPYMVSGRVERTPDHPNLT
jgi:hypothetical protein